MDEIKERREKQEAAPAKARVPAPRRLAAAPKPEAHGDAKEGGHAGGGGHELHWSYTGEGGPENWAQIKPEFATCSTGERQSPIDIREGIRVDLEAIKFDYRAGGFRVLNNGHTIQVNLPAGNQLSVMGRSFELLQFHFHRPSEERVNGRAFDMVAHLVHKDMDGKLAVVAVLLQVGDGHDSIQRVWNNLPLEKNLEQNANTTLDPTTLLPKDRSYYTYMGSLTTPPCSEGVLWMVMKSPVSISLEQLNVFAKLYPMNARPIQPAKGRLIKESR
jgi:carbonic anhydrase